MILVINAQEKRMFELIDGRRNIAEIVDRTRGDGVWPRAHAFFEKLWQYDQVVFNTSKTQ